MKNKIKKSVILLIWLLLWQITAIIVNNSIYFASPVEVITELAGKVREVAFWQSIGGSLVRIITGYAVAFILAFISAFGSLKCAFVKEFISPFVTFLKAVPVAAVAVILLIWWGPKYLVLCISLMIVYPNIYANMQMGLVSVDVRLKQMADVYKIGLLKRLIWIYRPAYMPYLLSSAAVSLGMCFKAGIAAEIIGLPELSIGERLYRDKIYLNTAGVFAWVAVILIISSVTERLLVYGLKRLSMIPKPCISDVKTSDKICTNEAWSDSEYVVCADRISKSYDNRLIVDTSVMLRCGEVYYLKAPSGSGKTTLLGMLSGIIKPDSGEVKSGDISMVFQDDRLIESANGLRNLEIAGCVGDLSAELKELIPTVDMELPVSKLSGGERRRLAIARAMLHPSDVVIMDEPFTGLDDDTKKETVEWIIKHLGNRTLLYTTHDTEIKIADNEIQIPLIDGDY